MNFENSLKNQAEMDAIKEKRKRVNELRDTDDHYTDSVKILAEKEDEIRTELKKDGLSGERLNEIADKVSDKDLEILETQKRSTLDILTGFYNRTFIDQNIPNFINLEMRSKRECSVLMLDIDYFKKVNDAFGHSAGDEVLKEVSKSIKKLIRLSDLPCRYGGEEFLIFLPDINIKKAKEIAERIRKNLEEKVTIVTDKNGEQKEVKITVSIGCSGTGDLMAEERGKSSKGIFKKIVEKADYFLYASKVTGRNKVMSSKVEQ